MKTTNARHAAVFLPALCLLALCGCARSLVKTTVNADGSWSRSLKFTAGRHDKPNAMSAGPSLQEAFLLPSGPEWKTRTDKDKDDVSFYADVSLRPGQAESQDVVVRSKKGLPVLVNQATVHEITPGTWEYRETLHWKGTPDQTTRLDDPEMLANFKKSLPPALATDANAKAIAAGITPAVWQALWGPPEPLVSQLILHPDFGQNMLELRLGKSLDDTLQAKFGDNLSSAQRADVEQALFASFASTVKMQGQSAGGDAGPPEGAAGGDAAKKDDVQAAALTFVAKVPGKIIATNGEVNPITQEVFWGLYPEAAENGDVTLAVTYQLAK